MEEQTRIKVWISKYALTAGVYQLDVHQDTPGMVSHGYEFFHHPHWHRARELALAKAEDMRLAKIASLKKQLSNLEKLSFV